MQPEPPIPAFFFDWYQATVPAHHELLICHLLEHFPEGVQRWPGKPTNNYKFSEYLVHEEQVLATVYHGGHNLHPNVKASGGDADCRHADRLSTILRTALPVHRVSRVDVATDRRGEGLFDQVQRCMHAVWCDQRAKGRKFRDQLVGGSAPEDGRTYYLGSKKSPLQCRAYEKGKERLSATGDDYWLDYLDLVRIELQVRPEKQFKSTAATLEPRDFWGCAEWSRQVAQGVLAMSAEPIMLKMPRLPDQERAMRAMTGQYGPTMMRQIEALGSWEAFCEDLHRRLGLTAESDHAA